VTKIFRRSLLCLLAILAALTVGASPSFAATSSWTISRLHDVVYASNSSRTVTFQVPQTSLPASPVITSTIVTVRPYSNGFTDDTIHICFQRQLEYTDYACYPDFKITDLTTVTIPTFNGQNAKGTVSVRQTLTGGTYPATSGGTTQDSVTVNYQY